MDKGQQAHQWAQEIYSISEKCLMAHSIRAVEECVERKRQVPFRIRIKQSPTQKYLGRRALAFIKPMAAEIKVGMELDFENRRLGIAHELAHILFVSLYGNGKTIAFDKPTEDACAIFEKQLCSRHDKFYANEENIKKLRFQSLWAEFGAGPD